MNESTRKAITGIKKLFPIVMLCFAAALANAQHVTPLLSEAMPDLPGKEIQVITVEYAPGSVDPIHRHNAHAVVYVLSGEIEMQVRGGKLEHLGPGQVFYESPTDVHTVGRNVSRTKPAKFVVFFVKNQGAPVLVPAK